MLCRSDSEFDEIQQNMMEKWANIKKEYINDLNSKYSDYFIKNKAGKIKSKLRKSKQPQRSNIGE